MTRFVSWILGSLGFNIERFIIGGVAVLVGLGIGWLYLTNIKSKAYNQGYEAAISEMKKKEEKRVTNATKADDAAKRCSNDPRCRVQNDGYRRD